MEKIQAGSSGFISGRDCLLIDLSSWYRDTLAPRISTLQDAIEERHLVTFRYYSPSGESDRTVEPCFLIFRWSSWYLWGFCRDREDFRLFKLNRMDRLRKTEMRFEGREAEMPDLSSEKIFPGQIRVRALFDPDQKWQLYEEFGPESFRETKGGKLLFTAAYTDMDGLISWLMTFGDKAEVLEPAEARVKIAEAAVRMVEIYRQEEKR
jgi:predicted DNA-binding transcriptional regulator YafY